MNCPNCSREIKKRSPRPCKGCGKYLIHGDMDRRSTKVHTSWTAWKSWPWASIFVDTPSGWIEGVTFRDLVLDVATEDERIWAWRIT